MQSPPDVFVNLAQATIRGSRNFHRLEQLGRTSRSTTLHEETVTNLLMAEMAGQDYVVSAGCPGCGSHDGCPDWDGSGSVGRTGVRVRALTKLEEGGHRGRSQQGVHADFVITTDEHDASTSSHGTRQVRMLVQAKRIGPERAFLGRRVDRKQYEELVEAATERCAVAYYALYLHQRDPHTSTATRCPVCTSAADRAIVLVPAYRGESLNLYRSEFESVVGLGRPLRCLGGCSCTNAPNAPTAWESILAFVRSDFPGYQPPTVSSTARITDVPGEAMRSVFVAGTPSLRGVRIRFVMSINAGRYKPGATPTSEAHQDGTPNGDASAAGADLLVVRSGRRSEADEIDRAYLGHSSSMSADERRSPKGVLAVCHGGHQPPLGDVRGGAGDNVTAVRRVAEGAELPGA